jgi:hypothetical protein
MRRRTRLRSLISLVNKSAKAKLEKSLMRSEGRLAGKGETIIQNEVQHLSCWDFVSICFKDSEKFASSNFSGA